MKNKKKRQVKRKFLYINAHPDDDMVVGGTMSKLVKAGWDVYELVCTSGKTAISDSNEKSPEEIKENRYKEVSLFCRQLGMKKPIVLDPDEDLLDANAELTLEIAKYIRKIRPDVVVLMNKDDYHIEHTTSHILGLRAFEFACRKTHPELGEPLSGGILLQTDGLNVLPNPLIVFDTSNTHKDKMKAVKVAYPDRVNDYLNNFVNGLALMRGSRLGYDFAEAYELLNPTWYKFKPESSRVLNEFVEIGSGTPPL